MEIKSHTQRLLITGKGWTGVGQNKWDNGWLDLGFDAALSSFLSMKNGGGWTDSERATRGRWRELSLLETTPTAE